MIRLPQPDRPEDLRPFLEAQLRWEKCHRVRTTLVLLVALSSSVLWLMLARPQIWGGPSRAAALAAWLVISAAASGAALAERRWYRLRDRRLRAVGQEEDAKDG
jgi:hypothetical protein